MKEFLIFGILVISFRVLAQDYSPKNITNSPFSWSVDIDHKIFERSQINELLKNGVSVNNKKNRCTFEFETKWDTKSTFAKKYGETYSERLTIECMVGDVRIRPNSVNCSKRKGSESEWDTLFFEIGISSIMISCDD